MNKKKKNNFEICHKTGIVKTLATQIRLGL